MTRLWQGRLWVNSRRKRAADIMIWLLWLPITFPLTIGLALLIMVCDWSNPFFTQKRVGKNGRLFTLYKLNTMGKFRGADSSRGATDERATRLGVFLRWTILDEIPQILLNVPLGDMSLVGPRPLIVQDVELMKARLSVQEYSDWHSAYISCLPGWTGKFGIDSRRFENQSDEYLHARAYHDDAYCRRATPGMDMKIVARHFKLFYLDLKHRRPQLYAPKRPKLSTKKIGVDYL